jgi:uncharacterized protein
MSGLKVIIQDAMKLAMKQHERDRLLVIRLILAEIKKKEIDDQQRGSGLTEEQILDLLVKMIKRRKEAILQFSSAGRQDLVEKENFEISVINDFLPNKLPEDELKKLIQEVINRHKAASIKDMANVMQHLRKTLAGAADLEQVGKMVKDLLLHKN